MDRIPIFGQIIGEEEKAALATVVDSGKLGQGPEVEAFEEKFVKIAGTDHAVAVSSGTAALYLALKALGLPRDSFVLTSPFTYVSTGGAVAENGLRPAYADISLMSYNLDDDFLEDEVRKGGVSALLPVHLYGLPAPMEGIADIARRHKLRLIEDCAQAVGATYKGRPVGSLGEVGCFSFNSKKIITTGEGGAVATNDRAIADAVRELRDLGQRGPHNFARLSGNFRMTGMQAAVGIVQVRRLPGAIERRNENAKAFTEAFSALRGLVLPHIPPGLTHVWYQYTVRVLGGKRDALRAHLEGRGIEAGLFYPRGLHRMDIFPGARVPKLPRCDLATLEVLSLPVNPHVGSRERERIVGAVREFYSA